MSEIYVNSNILTSILDIRVTREIRFTYSSSRQERTQISKCYLLAGFDFFGVFTTQEFLRRASLRELVFQIFCFN